MSYITCIEKAGAKVISDISVGDWQGTWAAYVEYGGKRGIVYGEYGSCCGCDAFEAEFINAYDDDERTLEERYALFGKSYIGEESDPDLYTIEEFLSFYEDENDGWFDQESQDLLDWANSLEQRGT